MTTTAALASEHADFITGGVSILVAGCDPGNETTVSRAVGCRVTDERRRVTVFVCAAQSGVFGDPMTHRAIQLKGADAAVVPLAADDPHLIASYRSRLSARVEPFGFSEVFVRALLSVVPGDVVAIAFTPNGAFSQTPGPKAGAPLQSTP